MPGTINRYQQPIFRGYAVGCERCHGPGELHVRRPAEVNGQDMTIVNPDSLKPSLRDAVCEQCHLNGHQRVLRLDHRNEDYRPGLPFHEFWTVLETVDGAAEQRFVGQVEQMHESRCFRASKGGSDAPPATIRIGCPNPLSRSPTTAGAAWSATPIRAVASRRLSGWNGAATTTA